MNQSITIIGLLNKVRLRGVPSLDIFQDILEDMIFDFASLEDTFLGQKKKKTIFSNK